MELIKKNNKKINYLYNYIIVYSLWLKIKRRKYTNKELKKQNIKFLIFIR